MMQRLTVGAGMLMVVGLVCAQAAAQDIPEEVRRQVTETFGPPFLVFRGKPALGIVRPDGTGAGVLFTVDTNRPLQSSWVK